MEPNTQPEEAAPLSIPAPPFADREAAAAAMAVRYPDHTPMLRVGGKSLDELSRLLLDKRTQARQLDRDIAALECQLKEKIGLCRGLKTRVGTWTWEKTQPSVRLDFKALARYVAKVAPDVLKAATLPVPPTRILRFDRSNSQPWPIQAAKTPKRQPADPTPQPNQPPTFPHEPADPVPGDR